MSSFFGLGPQELTSAQKIDMVEQEVRAVADQQLRLNDTCKQKCIPTGYREGELNKGEAVCLDRCVAKFFEAQKRVNEVMQQQMQKQVQLQQSSSGGLF